MFIYIYIIYLNYSELRSKSDVLSHFPWLYMNDSQKVILSCGKSLAENLLDLKMLDFH